MNKIEVDIKLDGEKNIILTTSYKKIRFTHTNREYFWACVCVCVVESERERSWPHYVKISKKKIMYCSNHLMLHSITRLMRIVWFKSTVVMKISKSINKLFSGILKKRLLMQALTSIEKMIRFKIQFQIKQRIQF